MCQRDAISRTGVTACGMAAVVLGLLIAAAAAILWRRLAGALVHPLQPGALLAAGISAATAAAAVRVGWSHRAAGRWAVWPDWTAMALTSLAAAGLLAGLWLPGTPLLPILAAVLVLLVEEIGVWAWVARRYARPKRRQAIGGADILVCPASHDRQECLSHRSDVQECLSRRGDAPPPEEVVQQLTRIRTADETEELRGWLRVPFAAGQRTASVHVAFCPPLAATPELAVEQIDGPDARLKTAQLLPYGARIDLKLAAAAEQAGVVVLEFVARAPIEKPSCSTFAV